MAPVTRLPPPGPHLPWQTPCPFCLQARTPAPAPLMREHVAVGGGLHHQTPRLLPEESPPSVAHARMSKSRARDEGHGAAGNPGPPPGLLTADRLSPGVSPLCPHPHNPPRTPLLGFLQLASMSGPSRDPTFSRFLSVLADAMPGSPVPPGTLTSQPLSPAPLVVSPPFPCQPGLRGPQRRGLGPQDECGSPPFPPGWG